MEQRYGKKCACGANTSVIQPVGGENLFSEGDDMVLGPELYCRLFIFAEAGLQGFLRSVFYIIKFPNHTTFLYRILNVKLITFCW